MEGEKKEGMKGIFWGHKQAHLWICRMHWKVGETLLLDQTLLIVNTLHIGEMLHIV